MTELFYSGTGERTKALAHGAMLGLAATFTAYNGIAWLLRRESHLARNACLYAALTIYEGAKVYHHRSARKEMSGLGRQLFPCLGDSTRRAQRVSSEDSSGFPLRGQG